MIQSESVDRRVEVVCPKSRVAVALSRFARETMTSKIQRDESVAGGQVRVELTVPGEPALRKAMDEQNRAACRVARLDQVKRSSAAAGNRVSLHRLHLVACDRGRRASTVEAVRASLEFRHDVPHDAV